ncbi:MAG TPA: hypothetical protein VFJ16_26605 [Longimicrobium sp.]|nr:hypothetical protein [Longimicrobium sp.]
MTGIEEELSRLFDEVPADLLAYFEEIGDDPPETLYRAAEAVETTLDFRGFIPLIQVLGGVILDDANTSNHHFYVTTPPLAGMVGFMSHDGDSRIVFASLPEFAARARSAIEQDELLEDLHPAASPPAADQPALSAFISRLLDDYEELDDGEEKDLAIGVLVAIIPSMDLTDHELLSRLASHPNLYLPEVVGDTITKRPCAGALRDRAAVRVASAAAGRGGGEAGAGGDRRRRVICPGTLCRARSPRPAMMPVVREGAARADFVWVLRRIDSPLAPVLRTARKIHPARNPADGVIAISRPRSLNASCPTPPAPPSAPARCWWSRTAPAPHLRQSW